MVAGGHQERPVSPADPAIGLIDSAEEIERELGASIPEEMVY
ncbi:MAG TPA: hypothetical protein VG370_25240 [Chloroflexota bacterium]|nr:hypothetical protein [Chloroflexota bacterium]